MVLAVCKLLKTTSKDLHSGGDLLSERVNMFGLEAWVDRPHVDETSHEQAGNDEEHDSAGDFAAYE